MKTVKVLALILAFTVICTISVFATDIKVGKNTPVLDGILSPDEYSPDSVYNLDKATVDKYNSVWTGTMTDNEGVKMHFAWADDGLYVCAEIKDITYCPGTSYDIHSSYGGEASDGLQINFFAHDVARWISVGAYADGKIAAVAHNLTDADGNTIDNIEAQIKGKATRDANAKSYVLEYFVPWNLLNNPDFKAGENVKIPVLFAYMDRADHADYVCYKTADAALWPPSTDLDVFLILGADYTAPVPATEAPAADTPSAGTPTAPKTGDAGIALALALLLASGVTLVSSKKKSVK